MPPAVQNLLQTSLPMPVVVVLVLQTAGFAWIGADKYTNLDMRMAAIEKLLDTQAGFRDRIVVLEQNMTIIREDVRDIKQIVRAQRTGQIENPAVPQ